MDPPQFTLLGEKLDHLISVIENLTTVLSSSGGELFSKVKKNIISIWMTAFFITFFAVAGTEYCVHKFCVEGVFKRPGNAIGFKLKPVVA